MAARTALLFLIFCAGIVVLYLGTRDQWDWSRLLRRVVFALVVVVGGVAGWIHWSSLPPTTPIAELWDVPLGVSEGDVRFLKGEPTEVVDPRTWVYAVDRSRTYRLTFADSGEIVRILVDPGPGYSSGVSLLGIRQGFGVERLIDRLGEPSRVISLADGLRRAYLYPHLNAVFVLEQGVVISLGIYDVNAGDPFAGA